VIVLKFGGTSVGDAEAIERSAGIVASRLERGPIVVVSAMAGVTNALLALGEQAARGHLIGALRAVEGIRERHLQTAESLLGGTAQCAETCAELSAMSDELAHLAEALATLGDLTPRSQDAIASVGERMSSLLCAAAIARRGVPSAHVDACQVMITDDAFMRAEPQPELIADACRASVLPLVRAGRVPVVTPAEFTDAITVISEKEIKRAAKQAAKAARKSPLTDAQKNLAFLAAIGCFLLCAAAVAAGIFLIVSGGH
jgi:aspartate kinase